MSVIYTAKGYLIYPSQKELNNIVRWLQKTSQMDEEEKWLNGSNEQFKPDLKQVYQRWNGLLLPYSYNYRNLSIYDLTENAYSARIAFLTENMKSTKVINENNTTIRKISMKDWFEQHTDHEKIYPFWRTDYVDDIFDMIDTTPPVSARLNMQLINATRDARTLNHELDQDNTPNYSL